MTAMLLLLCVPAQMPTPNFMEPARDTADLDTRVESRLAEFSARLDRLEKLLTQPRMPFAQGVPAGPAAPPVAPQAARCDRCNPDCQCGCQQGQPCRCLHFDGQTRSFRLLPGVQATPAQAPVQQAPVYRPPVQYQAPMQYQVPFYQAPAPSAFQGAAPAQNC